MFINSREKKSVALLIDPDKAGEKGVLDLLKVADSSGTDYIFIGGSLTFVNPSDLISLVKKHSKIPVILFPGNLLQLTDKADGILLLSLISGRNPELLIGNHVVAAPYLKKQKSKIIPTGYILINCGTRTSVEYMSQTDSIPASKSDIAVATSLAGEMLGLKMIYLEAGSGADYHVPSLMVKSVREAIDIPLVVGGGIRTASDIEQIYKAGADIIVLGNGCEKNGDLLLEACRIRDSYK
jgi:putative glycerol-1-phosphate prenyltransferase